MASKSDVENVIAIIDYDVHDFTRNPVKSRVTGILNLQQTSFTNYLLII